jgi:hypothetical protein
LFFTKIRKGIFLLLNILTMCLKQKIKKDAGYLDAGCWMLDAGLPHFHREPLTQWGCLLAPLGMFDAGGWVLCR